MTAEESAKPLWTNVVRDKPKTPDAREIFTSRKHTINLVAMARVILDDPAYAVTGAGGNADVRFNAPLNQRALRSALVKLQVFAHSPADSPSIINLTEEERAALVPLYGRFRRGADAETVLEKFIPDPEIMAIVHWAEIQRQNWDLSGLIGMAGGEAETFFPQALKTLAYIDPERFNTSVGILSTVRNLAKSDRRVLENLRAFGDKWGIEEGELLEMMRHDDWVHRVNQILDTRVAGRHGVRSGTGELGAAASIALLRTTWGLDAYRKRDAERQQLLTQVTDIFRDLLGAPGILAPTLEQIAFKKNASLESQAAYEAMRTSQTEVQALMNDTNKFEPSLRTLATSDPRDWANRTDPAASERLAHSWLDNEHHSRLDTPGGVGRGGGEFWSRLWQFVGSLFGTTYGNAEVGRVASRIRGLA